MHHENVLNGTKCVLFPILYRRNVLGGTKWIFASRIVRRGRVRRSDSSAQVLRNSRPEFRLLPLRDSMLFGYCLVAGRRLLPSERIAQHLSEWARTAGIHDQNAASSSAAGPVGFFERYDRLVAILMLTTGARVRNAYATYLIQGDNLSKGRLTPHNIVFRHLGIIK